MRRFLIVLNVMLLFALIAAGLFLWRGLHIDESVVFLPVERPDRTALTLRGESQLDQVLHDRVTLGGETIAMTLVGEDVGPLIVSCFGNASDRYQQGVDYAAKITPFGQVLLWDYPGYGDSSGEARVAPVEAAAKDLVSWVEAYAQNRPVIFWGHSLGGFVCSNMASQAARVDALILETTAPGIEAVAKAWTPANIPLRVTFDEDLMRFDVPAAAKRVNAPILIIGAGRDRVLPVELSRQLSEALPDATYLELPNATHFSAGFDPQAQSAVAELLSDL
ncbi:MAG: alpha/beta fold hydrolase [Pseudomonadota bacterium]